jgi:hypothetical protein
MVCHQIGEQNCNESVTKFRFFGTTLTNQNYTQEQIKNIEFGKCFFTIWTKIFHLHFCYQKV